MKKYVVKWSGKIVGEVAALSLSEAHRLVNNMICIESKEEA